MFIRAAVPIPKVTIKEIPASKPGTKHPYGGSCKYIVHGPGANGKEGNRRRREFFETKRQADIRKRQWEEELSAHGELGAALTQSQRAEYLDCLQKLEPYGLSLRDAVARLLPDLAQGQKTVPVEKAIRAMREHQEVRKKASARHLSDLKSRLGQFERKFSGRELASISALEIENWLWELPVGDLARNHSRSVVSGLFGFGLNKGWCRENPVTKTTKFKVLASEIGIISPEETAALLNHAPDDAVAALAIQAFCGLRPAELARLDWREVRLTGVRKKVEVKAGKAKTGSQRSIEIRDNLAAWLAPYVRSEGRVCSPNFRVRFDAARKAAGLLGKKWPHNALRHGFASYHAGHFRKRQELTEEMGHNTPRTAIKHYLTLVEPEDAARFWDIRPAAAPANVVPMRAEAA